MKNEAPDSPVKDKLETPTYEELVEELGQAYEPAIITLARTVATLWRKVTN